MSRPTHRQINIKGRRLAYRLLTIQSAVAVLMTAIFAVTGGAPAALSAAIGGLVSLTPNILFVALAFKHAGARSAQFIVLSFFAGEALKIVLSVVLLVVALLVFDGPLLPLFAVFALLHLMHILAPILLLKTN